MSQRLKQKIKHKKGKGGTICTSSSCTLAHSSTRYICFWRKSANISARSLCSLTTINGFFSSFWKVSGRYLNRHEQDHKIITSVTNIRTHCTSSSFFIVLHCTSSSCTLAHSSTRYIYVSDAKVQTFRLARSARSQPLMWFTNKILRRIACFRHTQKIGLLAIIYNSFFSSFWSVCKTFFRRKSTKILDRSLRSLDIIFLKFLVF